MKEFMAGGITYRLIRRCYATDKLKEELCEYILQTKNTEGNWYDDRTFASPMGAKLYVSKLIEYDGKSRDEVVDIEEKYFSITPNTSARDKNRQRVITDMCYAWRHDYGLPAEQDPGGYSHPYLSGMTDAERQQLWDQMAQVFDNVITPRMWFRNL